MRTNTFGEAYLGPDDNLDIVLDEKGIDGDVYARLIEFSPAEDAPVEGWGCEIADNDTGDVVVYLEGFDTEAALLDYLEEYAVEMS